MTTELIPVFTGTLQDQPVQLCNARDLHELLKVGKIFATWITDRIEKYRFTEGEDFSIVESLSLPDLGSSKARSQKLKDYHLTLDMAKELAMVENNEQGRQVRRYFIAIEREARKAGIAVPDTITPDQQNAIHQLVRRVAGGGRKIRGVWVNFNDHFKLGSYKQLPSSMFQAAVEYLESQEGEYLPKQEEAPQQPIQEFMNMFGEVKALLIVDAQGNRTMQLLPPGCVAFDPDEFHKLILANQVKREALPKIIEEAARRLA